MKYRYSFVGNVNPENGSFLANVFSSRREMLDYAQDEAHEGTYFVSTPMMTFKYTRAELLKI